MNENDIADKRDIKEFKGITFSKYKKSVKYKIIVAWITNDIKEATK